jgi:hypothetical protein
VSTSKVTKITEELCGCEISSSDVSRATKLLDEELTKWRNRPLSAVKYLILDARYEKVREAGCVRECSVLPIGSPLSRRTTDDEPGFASPWRGGASGGGVASTGSCSW